MATICEPLLDFVTIASFIIYNFIFLGTKKIPICDTKAKVV